MSMTWSATPLQTRARGRAFATGGRHNEKTQHCSGLARAVPSDRSARGGQSAAAARGRGVRDRRGRARAAAGRRARRKSRSPAARTPASRVRSTRSPAGRGSRSRVARRGARSRSSSSRCADGARRRGPAWLRVRRGFARHQARMAAVAVGLRDDAIDAGRPGARRRRSARAEAARPGAPRRLRARRVDRC